MRTGYSILSIILQGRIVMEVIGGLDGFCKSSRSISFPFVSYTGYSGSPGLRKEAFSVIGDASVAAIRSARHKASNFSCSALEAGPTQPSMISEFSF